MFSSLRMEVYKKNGMIHHKYEKTCDESCQFFHIRPINLVCGRLCLNYYFIHPTQAHEVPNSVLVFKTLKSVSWTASLRFKKPGTAVAVTRFFLKHF